MGENEKVQRMLQLVAEVLPPRPLPGTIDDGTAKGFTLSPLAIEQMHIRFGFLLGAITTQQPAQEEWVCGVCGNGGDAHAEGGPSSDCVFKPYLRRIRSPEPPAAATLKNPWTGEPRDMRDVETDPTAILCPEPGKPLRAATTDAGREDAEGIAYICSALGCMFSGDTLTRDDEKLIERARLALRNLTPAGGEDGRQITEDDARAVCADYERSVYGKTVGRLYPLWMLAALRKVFQPGEGEG